MAPIWERVAAAPALEEQLILDAVLRPHRSLSASGFRALLAVLILANVVVAGAFVAQGALPVAGFLGLDVLALFLAFRWNYRAARAEQRVRVAPGRVHVASVAANGAVAHWVLNPVWARVTHQEGPGVVVRAGRGQIRLGAFLSPKECESFARALDDALHWAKRGASAQSPSTSRME